MPIHMQRPQYPRNCLGQNLRIQFRGAQKLFLPFPFHSLLTVSYKSNSVFVNSLPEFFQISSSYFNV